jgi:membrane protein implicated in regulation of membrane protease activity
MASSGSTREGGGGLLFVVTVVFICLKLGGAVDWSWWIVLAPLWLPVAVYLGLFAAVFLVIATAVGFTMAGRALTPKRRRKPVTRTPRERLMRAVPRGRRKVYRVTTAQRRRR